MKKNQIFIMLSLLGTSIYAAEPPISGAIQSDATQRQP